MNTIKNLAKQEYEQNNPKIPFNLLFKMFAEGQSMASIGKCFGLSRERVRQIYNKHFKRVFNFKTGTERQIEQTEKKLQKELYSENKVVRLIKQKCEENGLKFQPVLSASGYSLRQKRVLINGYHCLISLSESKGSTFTKSKNNNRYCRLGFLRESLESNNFIIIWQQKKKRFFIYPTLLLLQTYKNDKGNVYLYVPFEEIEHKTRKPKINHFAYLENWKQLQQ